MNTVRIHIPTPLRPYAAEQSVVEVEAASVGEALRALVGRHAQLGRHLYDESGRLRRFVNVYKNDEDVRHLAGEGTPLAATDTISIVPSIAGGDDEGDGGERVEAAPAGLRKPGVTPETSGLHVPGGPSTPAGFRKPEAPPAPAGLRRGATPPAWATGEDGLPPMSQEELLRYSRHLILPEVGLAGQRKLKAASVLVVGSGGLGSPLALYLAAAGIGRMGIVDFDAVDESNLQRQVLFGTSSVGRPKIQVAAERLRDLNPNVRVDLHETRLESSNALDILRDYDVVADGTDNFPTRYLVNDACALLGKPNVYGSIFRFEGQASVFDARRGPCYRCLYPDPPPPGLVPSCAEGGVLGVLPGIIGVMQGIETIKLILGIGESLIGRLILFDALAMRFRELKLRKDPNCPLCGENQTITALIDYQEFCGMTPATDREEYAHDLEIGAPELAERLGKNDADLVVIDVREPHEFEIARIPGAKLIPLNSLPERLGELDSSREIVLHCHHGQRSMRALEFLKQSGFRKLKNLRGGIDAWSKQVDPSVPKY